MAKVANNKDEIVRALPKACADEATAVEFLEEMRWGDSPACPRCGSTDVYKMTATDGVSREKNYRWLCRDCKRNGVKAQYSVRTETVFEDSRIPLMHWCFAFWRASTSKKGVSAKEIQRQTGLSYKSALFLMHRIRFAMAPDGPQLDGTVEVDETYVGGKPQNKHASKRKAGRGTTKAPVVAVVQRGGETRAEAVANVTGANLFKVINEHVARNARLVTDEFSGYKPVGFMWAQHDTINHSEGRYVEGDITTNSVESFFARVKRSITGIHHSVSRKHLQRYLDHMAFLHSNSKLTDGARTAKALLASEGKRLYYREPNA